MFSTEWNLKFLATCDTLLMDGTFYTAPLLFTQVLIIHGRKRNRHVPLVHFLLTSKTAAAYTLALTKLRTFLPPTYTPNVINVDFECAIRSAIRTVWPGTTIQGCRFHLGQAWHRKIQSLGLSRIYKSRSAEGSYLRSFFGLSFIDLDEIKDFFSEEFTQNEPPHAKIREFSDYVYDNYICATTRFPPHLWTKYSAEVGRTTNACEAFHSVLNKMFYHCHPNIFLLADAFLEVQESSYGKMLSRTDRGLPRATVEKQVFIQNAMDEYEEGLIDKKAFVKQVSRTFLPQ